MIEDKGQHQDAVTAWFQRAAQGRSVESLVQAFENTFAALWQRSSLVLGEATLASIVERVLHTATEQAPLLGSIEVDTFGLRCERLRLHADLHHDQVSAAIRVVLVEFLTVLGSLTAQILTPALHAEMSRGHTNAGHGTTEDHAS